MEVGASVGAPSAHSAKKGQVEELRAAAKVFGVYMINATLEASQEASEPEHSYGGAQANSMVMGLYNQAVAEQLVGTNSLGFADLLIEQANLQKSDLGN